MHATYAAVAILIILALAYFTTTFQGTISASLSGINNLSGNETGQSQFAQSFSHALGTASAAPDVVAGGGYQGTFTCPTTGATLNLADSTNICKTGAVGTIAPAQGYVITAVKKLRCLILENTDAAITVTVTIPATLGLAGLGWGANATVVVLQPNSGAVVFNFPAGSSVLTAGTNDALVFTSGSGTPTVKIGAAFG